MRRRRTAQFTLLLLIILTAIPVAVTWREVRQMQLNQLLVAAVRRNDTPDVVALLKQGADANAREGNAAHLSIWSLLRSRLDGKAITNSHAATALAIACGYSSEPGGYSSEPEGNPAIMAALLAKGADPNGKNPDGNAMIIWPIRWENAASVRMLLDAGANPNATDDEGTPALLAAVGGPEISRSQVKLPNGQMVTEFAIGHRVLNAAQWKAEYVIVKALLDRGAKVDARCYGGDTALHRVVRDDYMEAIRLLIARGANVNARDDDGETPLIAAAGRGSSGAVRFLLAHGADIQARNNEGRTALLDTAEYGYPEVIQMLLAHGADVNAKDSKGRGVLKIARKGFDNGAAYRLLKRAGARE